jgi:glycerol-3-phosphate dehydrogenase
MDTSRITSRRVPVEDLPAKPVDLLVIGGGITGSGIAREAAARGLSTILLDRSDLAGGRRAPSSPLVYGSLQHWDQGTLHLRLAPTRERLLFQATAPHLVRPTRFILPIQRRGQASRWQLVSGVLYRQWAGLFRNVRWHRLLGKRNLLELEPLLRDRGLVGGVMYQDALYDGTRLVVATARSAARHGAVIASYTAVESLDIADGKIRGAAVRDSVSGTTGRVQAGAVVNATGPWIDSVRRFESDSKDPLLALRRSAYLAVPRVRLGHHHAMVIDSPLDGRLIQVVPWTDRSVIGPSVTEVEHADAPGVTDEDILYLLRSVNASFPNARLTRDDIRSTWSYIDARLGGRDDHSRRHAGRHCIEVGPHGLITVVGGSAGHHRTMAREAVDVVIEALRASGSRSGRQSDSAAPDPLPGGEAHDMSPLRQPGLDLGLAPATVDHLLETFGTEAAAVYNLCRDRRDLMTPLHPDHPAVLAEVVHCARRELVTTVDDVLTRRLHVRWETDDAGRTTVEAAAMVMAAEMGWDDETRQASVAAYRATLPER